jgi:hypothetical protein
MSRYATAKVLRDQNGKRRLSSVIMPTPNRTADDLYIQITSPDRLDKLAQTFYNDDKLWYVIAAANGLGKGSLMVPGEIILRIPNIGNIQNTINNTNNER